MDNKQMEQMAREHDMSGIDPQFAEEVAEAVAKGSVSAYQKIEKGVVNGYKKIETGVVTGYKKIENGVETELLAQALCKLNGREKEIMGEK